MLEKNYQMCNGKIMPECIRIKYNELTRKINELELIGKAVELLKNDRHRLFIIALELGE